MMSAGTPCAVHGCRIVTPHSHAPPAPESRRTARVVSNETAELPGTEGILPSPGGPEDEAKASGTLAHTIPPAPVCEKCGHMEHPDGECCWPLRRGPAGYVHKHCNCGGKRTPTPAPDLSPCTDCPPSDTTHAKAEHAPDDEMRPEYDFREGERGKYFERYNAPPEPFRDLTKEEGEAYGKIVDEAFAPPEPVCDVCGKQREQGKDCGYCGSFHLDPPAPERMSEILPRIAIENLSTEMRHQMMTILMETGPKSAGPLLLAHDAALRAEIAALKACYSEHLNGVTVWDWKRRALKAEAEVERLRGALERIAHQDIDCGLGKGICDTCNGPTIAREALEGKA